MNEALPSAQRPAHLRADDPHVRLDPAMRIERAIVRQAVGTLGHRDRPFDRLDDVGQADVGNGKGERIATACAARTGEQARRGEPLHQFLRGWQRDSGLLGKLGRTQPSARGPARGGGHHHDCIVGKVGQAHIK